MIADITRQQIGGLSLSRRPLVICDVDEVVVHFTRDLEIYLGLRGLRLETSNFALSGNIRRKSDGHAIERAAIQKLIEEFFMDHAHGMQPIDGAVEALQHIGEVANIVLLTNLPHEAGALRRRNMADLGLAFPVVTNAGPKGPAVKSLAGLADGAVVFIDDSPGFIASAFEHAPEVHLVHFLHDERFARHAEPLNYVSLRTGSWTEAKPHVLKLIG